MMSVNKKMRPKKAGRKCYLEVIRGFNACFRTGVLSHVKKGAYEDKCVSRLDLSSRVLFYGVTKRFCPQGAGGS